MRITQLLLISAVSATLLVIGQQPATAQRVRQPRDVIEAYGVCRRFQQLLADDLNFEHAFEETFVKSPARRRAIAIAEGEFGAVDVSKIDDVTLVNVYKDQMQILFLMMPLIGPETKEDEDRYFPPPIKLIFDRPRPETTEEIPRYASQLKQDVANLRAHLSRLAAGDPAIANRIEEFKSQLTQGVEVPRNHVVRPLTSYSKGHVLDPREKYYQIGDYAVIREGAAMKIIGIRFFSRLF